MYLHKILSLSIFTSSKNQNLNKLFIKGKSGDGGGWVNHSISISSMSFFLVISCWDIFFFEINLPHKNQKVIFLLFIT